MLDVLVFCQSAKELPAVRHHCKKLLLENGMPFSTWAKIRFDHSSGVFPLELQAPKQDLDGDQAARRCE